MREAPERIQTVTEAREIASAVLATMGIGHQPRK
jgi:hypothetical protein